MESLKDILSRFPLQEWELKSMQDITERMNKEFGDKLKETGND